MISLYACLVSWSFLLSPDRLQRRTAPQKMSRRSIFHVFPFPLDFVLQSEDPKAGPRPAVKPARHFLCSSRLYRRPRVQSHSLGPIWPRPHRLLV